MTKHFKVEIKNEPSFSLPNLSSKVIKKMTFLWFSMLKDKHVLLYTNTLFSMFFVIDRA